ncbi:MAG TPA: nitroreductase/quinone reductase family protein [Candidatus Limnocylindrales bacterium]|nr:nitroreductase/quinone reductase family protein [Candidatus Limnocylindrales bacterium]
MPDAAANAWEESFVADIRAHGGRPSEGPLKGHPILFMWSVGKKSGERRRSILTYSRDGDAFVVAGSKGGSPTDPLWVANVEAHPRVTIEVANQTFEADGQVFAEGPERDRLWRQHVAELPWFGKYEEQTSRTIPTVRLVPVAK